MSAGEAGRRQQRIAADEMRDNLLGFILAHDGVTVQELCAALDRREKTIEKEVGRLKTLGYIDFFRNGNARRWMNADCAQGIQRERDAEAKIRQEKRLCDNSRCVQTRRGGTSVGIRRKIRRDQRFHHVLQCASGSYGGSQINRLIYLVLKSEVSDAIVGF